MNKKTFEVGDLVFGWDADKSVGVIIEDKDEGFWKVFWVLSLSGAPRIGMDGKEAISNCWKRAIEHGYVKENL